MGLRFLLMTAGVLVAVSVFLGLSAEAAIVVLLGMLIAIGGFTGRVGSLVSVIASLTALALVWMSFDQLVRAGNLADVGIGFALALIGGLTGAVAGSVTMLQGTQPRYESRSVR